MASFQRKEIQASGREREAWFYTTMEEMSVAEKKDMKANRIYRWGSILLKSHTHIAHTRTL